MSSASSTSSLPAAARYHDTIAAEWDELYRSGGFQRRAAMIEAFLSRLPLRGQRWLDAGCGSGYFSRRLVEGGAKVRGLDASTAMIEAARAHAQTVDPQQLHFEHVSTIETLDEKDASYDGILCLSVLEYLDAPEATLGEFARVLRPGGHLLLSLPQRSSLVRQLQQKLRGVGSTFGRDWCSYLSVSKNAYEMAELHAILKRAGFEARHLREFDPILPETLVGLLPGSLLFVLAQRMS